MSAGVMAPITTEWATPQWLFDELNERFAFTLDPCATIENAKCGSFFAEADDGLAQSWEGETVFMNPPYGRQIGRWVRKAYEEALRPHTVTVCLIPARTDTAWWHTYVMRADEVHLIQGRVRFVGKTVDNAPFPSCIVVFNGVHRVARPYFTTFLQLGRSTETNGLSLGVGNAELQGGTPT